MAPSIRGVISDSRLHRPTDVAKHPTAPYCYVFSQSNISAGRTGDITIVNVSNLDAPFIVGSLTGYPNGGYLVCRGNKLFVLNHAGLGFQPVNFYIFDITNPTSPTLLGGINTVTLGSGGVIYVKSETEVILTFGTSGGGLSHVRFLNCTNPAAPTIAYTIDGPENGAVEALYHRGNILFVGHRSGAVAYPLRAYDITNTFSGTAPTLVGTVTVPNDSTTGLTSPGGFSSNGRYIYWHGTAGSGYRTAIIDSLDPAAMVFMGVTTAGTSGAFLGGPSGNNPPWGPKYLGDQYIGQVGSSSGASMWSISSPLSPTRVADIVKQAPLWGPWGNTWEKEIAYIGNGTQQFGSDDNRFIIVDMDVDFPIPATATPATINTSVGAVGTPGVELLMPYITNISPDPATTNTVITITGRMFDQVRSVIIDGVGREFTYVNPTTIKVTLPLMTSGLKSVHLEYL